MADPTLIAPRLIVTPRETRRYQWRQFVNALMLLVATLLAALGVGVLLLIFIDLLVNGVSSLQPEFFLRDALDGGIANAITGTLILVTTAAVLSVPLAILTAIYLAEYGTGTFAGVVRFCIDLLAQMPSIVIGIFIWLFVVDYHVLLPTGITAALALAIIILPIVARTVEEILRLVPDSLREAALALGVPRWRVVTGVVLPTVLPGILTGVLLGLARAAGETAPILLVAGSDLINLDLFHNPMGAIPLQIYKDTTSGNFPRAYSAAIVLVVVLALLSAILRAVTSRARVQL